MHTLGAHLYSRQLGELIFVVNKQSSPPIDIVDDILSLLLFCIHKLHHAYGVPGAVETI